MEVLVFLLLAALGLFILYTIILSAVRNAIKDSKELIASAVMKALNDSKNPENTSAAAAQEPTP